LEPILNSLFLLADLVAHTVHRPASRSVASGHLPDSEELGGPHRSGAHTL
jgi:hypothetical protein